METKECKKCKKQLPVKDFPKDNRSKDGLWRFCRACESARKKAYRQKLKTDKAPTKPTKPTVKGKAKKVIRKKI